MKPIKLESCLLSRQNLLLPVPGWVRQLGICELQCLHQPSPKPWCNTESVCIFHHSGRPYTEDLLSSVDYCTNRMCRKPMYSMQIHGLNHGFLQISLKANLLKLIFCRRGFPQVWIDFDLTISPCCFDSFSFVHLIGRTRGGGLPHVVIRDSPHEDWLLQSRALEFYVLLPSSRPWT